MPARYRKMKPAVTLSDEERQRLEQIRISRSESVRHVTRATILLLCADGHSKISVAEQLGVSRVMVDDTVSRVKARGVLAALDDLPRSGHPTSITPEAKAWFLSLACQKPKDLGYPHEVWTHSLLAQHVRGHCEEAGHPSLQQLAKGTISKMLRANSIHPHRVEYYLEKRDPAFEHKMVQVLEVYQEVEILQETEPSQAPLKVILSYDEKPGVQAIANTPHRIVPPHPGSTDACNGTMSTSDWERSACWQASTW
ncbi:helix-turn-helix domain-containing protein [Ferroacidibacillus organovorans]|uniref:helix-turn-helix domain-containing protein n=1 Tax=Ferroacidibacillus organovorans TaxID=1765683 RepID=UPI000B18A130|nr:helix-turn-helix domain-containing protein [Ferroacidibacillus organovorans]